MIRSSIKQRGATLILVLGVLAIISVLSVQVIETANGLARAQTSQTQLQQSFWYAKAGEEYAKLISKDYLYKKMLLEEHTNLHFPISDGDIHVTLTPLQNCFNLNSLSNRSGVNIMNRAVFDMIDNPNISGDTPKNKAEQALDINLMGIALKRRQLEILFSEYELDSDRAQFFSDRLVDWLDEDNLPTASYGAENTYYAALSPSRETPNQHLMIKEEMHDFLGDELLKFSPVMPLLCVHPGDNKLQININQLTDKSATLLSAILLAKIDTATAQRIIEERPEKGFDNLADFWSLPAFKDLDISIMQKKAIVLENRYFQVKSQVSYKESQFTLHSLIRINTNKQVHVISRKYGVNS